MDTESQLSWIWPFRILILFIELLQTFILTTLVITTFSIDPNFEYWQIVFNSNLIHFDRYFEYCLLHIYVMVFYILT